MDLAYERFTPPQVEPLVEFLAGERWPYHTSPEVDPETVRRRAAEGYYDNPSVRTFWIMAAGERAGLIRLEDLGDGTPLFDLRVRAAFRGRGIGGHAVRWLTEYLFTVLPEIGRIEGTTRQDNRAGLGRRAGLAPVPSRPGSPRGCGGRARLRPG